VFDEDEQRYTPLSLFRMTCRSPPTRWTVCR